VKASIIQLQSQHLPIASELRNSIFKALGLGGKKQEASPLAFLGGNNRGTRGEAL
jgi:hypothetical protein